MCLKTFFNRLNWSEARLECQNEGADLVRVFYDSMRLDLVDYTVKHTDSLKTVWIALTYSSKLKKYTWPGDSDENATVVCLSNVTMILRFTYSYMEMQNVLFFVLSLVAATGCPRGWFSMWEMDVCIRDSVEKVPYSSARSWCASLNSTVVTLKNQRKHLDYLDYRERFNYAWIGVTDQEEEGHFVWATGGAARYLYENLMEDGYTRENCLHTGATFNNWIDDDCNKALPFICQKQANRTGVKLTKDNILFRPPDGLSSPVMEVKPRLIDVSTGIQPHIQNVYFVGNEVNVTCRALRVRSGGLSWTFLEKGRSDSPVFDDLDNYIDNYVDGPHKGPELSIEFPLFPSTIKEGDVLVALCKVYPGEGGSLVWVISPGSGDSRTLENHVDT
ncbi:hypothetical protein EGW08_007683 [Elysia chlorotica]|uniref:C-type lectin domain-containing protein n=1 Tax=Elysia chlorotica TaxID=188477 RepID=A0A433TST6_ELYCH|nr:hypothetical protein EGW08_007683 [Elysia chlorotica]